MPTPNPQLDAGARFELLAAQGQDVVEQLARDGGPELVNMVMMTAMRWNMDAAANAPAGLVTVLELTAAVARAGLA